MACGILLSFGATNTIFSFLRRIDVTIFQATTKRMYERGVARVQMHIQLPARDLFFTHPFLLPTDTLIVLNFDKQNKRCD